MRPSIRFLFLGQILACIVIVATLCTSLAVWSGDRALSDTAKSRDDSVAAAFDVGQSTVLKVTDDYLNQVGDSTVKTLDTFWAVPRNAVTQMCHQLMTKERATLESWDYLYSWRSTMYHMVKTFTEYDGLGIVTLQYQTVQIGEGYRTLTRGPQEYHHFVANVNNGTAYDMPGRLPARNRTVQCDVVSDGSGDCYGYPDQELVFPTQCDGSMMTSSASNGSQLDLPCAFLLYDTIQTHLPLLPHQKMGVSLWVPPTTLGPYTGLLSQCVYGDPSTGEKLGMVYVGTEQRKITDFLKTIDIGNARGSLGRIFATVRFNWLSPVDGDKVGLLAGTSHGSSQEVIPDPRYGYTRFYVGPIYATNCSDMLVSYTAKHMQQPHAVNETLTLPLSEVVYQSGKPFAFQMPTNRTPVGETFYIGVKVFDDGYGLNWYVNSVIDREYILGQVDAMNAATLAAVRESEDKVNADLDEARILLFAVVAAAALLPLVFSVFLVFRVTQPLVKLMQEMAHVAVMDLEYVDVDRPASKIAEVHDMENSFRQMIRNLVEYRQYLPQSVLYDSATEEEALQPSRTTQSDSGILTDHKFTTSDNLPFNGLFDSSLRTRNVTVMVTNICDLHATQSHSALSTLLATYLEPFLHLSKKCRGIIDDVSGDKVALSFNSTMPSASHRLKPLELFYLLRQQWGTSLQVNAGVATGATICGNIGCVGMKKYALIGNAPLKARTLERCGRSWGLPLVCDNDVADDVKLRFIVRVLVMAQLKGGKNSLLHEVLEMKTLANDEWMYQMQECAESNPHRFSNRALGLLYDDNIPEAHSLLRDHGEELSSHAALLISEAVRKGRPPKPLQLSRLPPMVDPNITLLAPA